MNASGFAGAAAIIRVSKSYLPIKLIAFLGKVESSQAELWSAILAFAMLDVLKQTEKITWISDSQTTLNFFSKKLSQKNTAKHQHEWQLLDKLSSNLIICCQHRLRTTKHKDLLACDRASRWATNLGEKINSSNALVGRNILKDPRYAWQVVNLTGVFKGQIELAQLLKTIKVYANSSTSEYSQQ